MAYLTDNGGALVPGVNAPAAVATTDLGSKLIQLIKDLSPLLLVILIIWLLMQDDDEGEVVRKNPRWKSLPEWKATEPPIFLVMRRRRRMPPGCRKSSVTEMISSVSIAPMVYTAGSTVAGGAYTFTMQGVPKQAVPVSWLRPDVGLGAAPTVDLVNIAGVGVGLLAVGLVTIMLLKRRGKRK